jgi:hypothetical protein
LSYVCILPARALQPQYHRGRNTAGSRWRWDTGVCLAAARTGPGSGLPVTGPLTANAHLACCRFAAAVIANGHGDRSGDRCPDRSLPRHCGGHCRYEKPGDSPAGDDRRDGHGALQGASGPQERSTIARCLPRPRFTGLSMSDAASHHAVPIGVPQALIRLH